MAYREGDKVAKTKTPAGRPTWWHGAAMIEGEYHASIGRRLFYLETPTLFEAATWFEARERARVVFGTDRVKVWAQ